MENKLVFYILNNEKSYNEFNIVEMINDDLHLDKIIIMKLMKNII